MFSQVSVCPKGVSRPKPRGVCLPRGDVQAQAQGVCPGGCPGGVKAQAQAQGVCPGGCPGGVKAQAQAQGISRPRPRGVYIPAYTEADTPPSRRLLLHMVRILLECILVVCQFTLHYAPSCQCLKIPSGTITRAEFCEKNPTYFH